MRIGLVQFAVIHSPPSVNDEKLCIGRYTSPKNLPSLYNGHFFAVCPGEN